MTDAEEEFDNKIKGRKMNEALANMGPHVVEIEDKKKEYEDVQRQLGLGVEDELLSKRNKIDDVKSTGMKGKKKLKGNPNNTMDVSLNENQMRGLNVGGGSFIAKKNA